MLITKAFTIDVSFDPEKTDEEALATALDRLMVTALSTNNILGDYGEVYLGQFFPSNEPAQVDPKGAEG